MTDERWDEDEDPSTAEGRARVALGRLAAQFLEDSGVRGRHDALARAWALDRLSLFASQRCGDEVRKLLRVKRTTWTQLGEVFGITRQGATKRFGP